MLMDEDKKRIEDALLRVMGHVAMKRTTQPLHEIGGAVREVLSEMYAGARDTGFGHGRTYGRNEEKIEQDARRERRRRQRAGRRRR